MMSQILTEVIGEIMKNSETPTGTP